MARRIPFLSTRRPSGPIRECSMSDRLDVDLECLSPAEVRIRRDPFGRLCMTVGETTYENVRPVRAFPISAPGRYVGFLDENGVQIGIVANLRALDGRSRRVVEEELEMLYFCAQVEAILDVQWKHHYTTWLLLTDRGERLIVVRDRSDIRSISETHLVITDVDGIRYEIRDTTQLDERSRAFLEEEL